MMIFMHIESFHRDRQKSTIHRNGEPLMWPLISMRLLRHLSSLRETFYAQSSVYLEYKLSSNNLRPYVPYSINDAHSLTTATSGEA